jgi:hypothetical protein
MIAEVRAPNMAYCEGCGDIRNFEYDGEQTLDGEKRLFDYYSCGCCGTTRTFNHSKLWTGGNLAEILKQLKWSAGSKENEH